MSVRRLSPLAVLAILSSIAAPGLVAAPASARDRAAARAATQAATQPAAQGTAPARAPDVIFVPTPEEVVDAMLKVAKVTARDVVYDLGCGDGRIVITAAKKYGARGVGIDIDPQRIAEATANATKEGVTDRVSFRQADLFTSDIGEATVVTLYLLPSLNLKLLPKLMKELKPGTRVVSHAFDMGDEWPPEQTLDVDGRKVYYWTIPKR
jgi:SAM-dependent methyltransferase